VVISPTEGYGLSQAKQLYNLQEIDLHLDTKRDMLAGVEGQLGESQALIAARDAVEQEKQRLAELEKEQQAAEWAVEDTANKTKLLEEKLYSGKTSNLKELAGLQHEVEHLKSRQSQQEDRALELMSQVEAARDRLKAGSRETEHIEAQWRQQQEQLLKEQAALTADLAALDQERGDMAARIPSSDMELYEILRRNRQGQAVARVEQGMCQGCRISLPMSELQRARSGEELVQCGSCERILHLG
jgi:predicted  nucleic acid-binding Zn-ribbon protein